MESNITDRQYLGADLQLAEPHFDEEATVLSARPVVPLHQVRAGARSGRRLGFGLAILAALLIGAFGATLIYQQRGKEEKTIAEPASSISEPAVQEGPVGGASGSDVYLNESALSIAENPNAGTTRQAHSAPASHAKKRAPEVLRSAPAGRGMTRQNEAINRENKREMWRAERMEARRERKAERRAQRDAGRHESQPSDNLFRIREIFEGSRKP